MNEEETAGTAQAAPPLKRKKNWKPIWYTLAIIAIVSFQEWRNYAIREKLDKQVTINMNLQQERSNEAFKTQELNKQLQAYKPHERLVKTVAARDAAADSIMSWLGKQVMLKHDSSIVVVTNVFFGGSRYENRLWCEVTNKQGIVQNVTPELIQP